MLLAESGLLSEGMGAKIAYSGSAPVEFRTAAGSSLVQWLAGDFTALAPDDVDRLQCEAMIREVANFACGAVLAEWRPEAEFHLALPELLGYTDRRLGRWPNLFIPADALAGTGIEMICHPAEYQATSLGILDSNTRIRAESVVRLRRSRSAAAVLLLLVLAIAWASKSCSKASIASWWPIPSAGTGFAWARVPAVGRITWVREKV